MTGRWNWGLGMATAYGLFATGTLAFAVFAMRQDVDLVASDYYAQSLVHDATTAARARAAALGDLFRIEVDPSGRVVTVSWPPAMARATGTIRLYRPSNAREDRTRGVAPDADGRQRLSLAGAAPGRWVIQVRWQADGVDHYAERALVAR